MLSMLSTITPAENLPTKPLAESTVQPDHAHRAVLVRHAEIGKTGTTDSVTVRQGSQRPFVDVVNRLTTPNPPRPHDLDITSEVSRTFVTAYGAAERPALTPCWAGAPKSVVVPLRL